MSRQVRRTREYWQFEKGSFILGCSTAHLCLMLVLGSNERMTNMLQKRLAFSMSKLGSHQNCRKGHWCSATWVCRLDSSRGNSVLLSTVILKRQHQLWQSCSKYITCELKDNGLAQKSISASPYKLTSALLFSAWTDPQVLLKGGQLKWADASFPKNDWWCFFPPLSKSWQDV